MKKSYLNRGIICVLAGLCFLLAAVFTESVFDGLLWGFAGGALGPGIGWIIQHFYWSAPKNQVRYQEMKEQADINLHDELNEKLRDKSGRIAYLIGLLIICISEVVFSILGNAGIISNYKVIVLYLFVLLLVQIVIGKVAYRQLRKKY
jgi:positive regulator of sigma E activity